MRRYSGHGGVQVVVLGADEGLWVRLASKDMYKGTIPRARVRGGWRGARLCHDEGHVGPVVGLRREGKAGSFCAHDGARVAH